MVGAGGLIGDLLNQSIQNNILSKINVISENHYKKLIFFISVILLTLIHYLNKLIIKFKNKKQHKLIDQTLCTKGLQLEDQIQLVF